MTRFALRFWMCAEPAALSRSIAISFNTAGSRSSVYLADSGAPKPYRCMSGAYRDFRYIRLLTGSSLTSRHKSSMKLCGSLAVHAPGFRVAFALRLSATAARITPFKAASSISSISWMSMARLTSPSRLELNRPEGSFNAAPPFNSSKMSGSAWWTIPRNYRERLRASPQVA